MAHLRYVFILLLCVTSARSFAVAPLLASEFARHCASSETQREVPERCVLYISGFLDGAVATDARVAVNVADEYERAETITERAIRTRISERIERHGASVYAEYCIGAPVPIAQVVDLVRQEILRNPPGQGELARDLVYSALRKYYPCRE